MQSRLTIHSDAIKMGSGLDPIQKQIERHSKDHKSLKIKIKNTDEVSISVCTSVMRISGCSKKTRQLCPEGISFSDQSRDDTTPGMGVKVGVIFDVWLVGY